MKLNEFNMHDLIQLPLLQPSGWDDLRPHFTNYLDASYCKPMKIEIDGQLIAVGVVIYHKQTCWLAHIIVKARHRNKGIGQYLTKSIVNTIDRKKYQSIFLIATDLGYPVYLKTGFRMVGTYHELKLKTRKSEIKQARQLMSFRPQYYQDIIAMDRKVSGENRIDFIEEHIQNSILWIDNDVVQGVYFPSLADGYLMATNVRAGLDLLSVRAKKFDYAILPSLNTKGLHHLNSLGYVLKSRSRRMAIGPDVDWQLECIYNRISGQIG